MTRAKGSTMTTYKAVQVGTSGQLELTERQMVDPADRQVRLRVEACGICHTDSYTVNPAGAG
jgi:propanol-preferring alcohol dehydrogenase